MVKDIKGNLDVQTLSRAAWVRPELKRLSAGAAESNESGANFDNSNPQRS